MQEIKKEIQKLIALREERKRIYIQPISNQITKLKKRLFIREMRKKNTQK